LEGDASAVGGKRKASDKGNQKKRRKNEKVILSLKKNNLLNIAEIG